jgi:hypothetical protein
MPQFKDASSIMFGEEPVTRVMHNGVVLWGSGYVPPPPDPDPDPPPGGWVRPAGLPQLGFSVNSEALAGPVQQSHYNNLRLIGGEWIRTGFAPGYSTTLSDKFFYTAVNAGMNVLLRASLPDSQYSGSSPVNVEQYGDHMAELAARYKGKGPGGANPVMEYPNELNGRVTGATYAAMAENAYPKLKAVDPTYQVIGASENVYVSTWATWLEDVYRGGFAQYSDGLSWHNYDGPAVTSKWDTMLALRTKYNDNGVIWLTEFGGTTCTSTPSDDVNDNGCLTELGQANKIIAVINNLKTSRPYVTHAILYTDEDIPSRQSTDPFEANFGIYENDSDGNITRAKPAVAKLKTLYGRDGTVGGELTISSSPLPSYSFPLSVSGRGYLDATGKPYLGVADTCWNAISRMTRTEFTSYITQRRAQGYTAILMSVLDVNSRSRTQATSGTTPFNGTNNSASFTSRNTSGTISYWDQVVWCVDQLAAQGMLAVLVPGWFGYRGATWRGHWATSNSDTSIATSYGTFLASILGGKSNVAWLHGGDSGPTTGTQTEAVPSGMPQVDVTAAMNAVANTISNAATVNQLHTYHTFRNDAATTYFGSQSWYDVNAAYSGQDPTARVIPEWNRTNNKPVFMVEMYYSARSEVGVPTPHLSRQDLRAEAWQSMCSGALITANGSEYVWQVRDFYSGFVWTQGMNLQSAGDITVLSRIFATFPAKFWVADHAAPIVATNRGLGLTLAAGLVSSDAKVGIVYVPDARSITINTTRVPNATWYWVHPETAQVTPAGNFTVPSGWVDAVLVGYTSGSTSTGSFGTAFTEGF